MSLGLAQVELGVFVRSPYRSSRSMFFCVFCCLRTPPWRKPGQVDAASAFAASSSGISMVLSIRVAQPGTAGQKVLKTSLDLSRGALMLTSDFGRESQRSTAELRDSDHLAGGMPSGQKPKTGAQALLELAAEFVRTDALMSCDACFQLAYLGFCVRNLLAAQALCQSVSLFAGVDIGAA